jgi:glycosyltransferase involved in cell wall biosynthesis
MIQVRRTLSDERSANPLVSVVMTVYNGEKYLAAAIQSLLDQTYSEFELIVVDDGSIDQSGEIVASFTDPRIKKIAQSNRGLSPALNTGIEAARGTYIARHDADDLSDPSRLALQVIFLEKHKDVALLGSNYHVIDATGAIIATTDVFTHPTDLKLAEIASNQFGHGAVMLRKQVLDEVGGYDERFTSACDVDLWNRIGRRHRIANLANPLYMWRNAGQGLSTTSEGADVTALEVQEIRSREFEELLRRGQLFRAISFQLGSIRGGTRDYLRMKNTMYRDLALLAAYSGRRRLAVTLLLLGAVHAPWVRRTYRQLVMTITQSDALDRLPYESI